MKKKILGILLSFCMIFMHIPNVVFADDGTPSGVYIFFDSSAFNTWNAPLKAYIYDEDTNSGTTYSNAFFPGQKMQEDPATGYYYIEVSDSSCIAKDKNSGESTASIFDLAHSPNTYVIISSSNGQRYPGESSKTKLRLDGSSKLLSGTTSSDWKTFVPSATVTYDLNGGTINSGNVTQYIYGQGAVLPTDVTKTGYTFAGWYADENFSGDPVTLIGKIDTGKKVFYAKWNPVRDKLISITSPDPITVENGTAYEDMNLPKNVKVETSLNSVTRLPVEWNTARPAGGSYDPDIKTEQTVTLYGILQLPDGFEEILDGHAATTITITIKAAPETSGDSDKDNDSKTDVTDDSNNESKIDVMDNSNDDNESKSDKASVKTGDTTNLALWIALMLLSSAGIGGVTLYTRRKKTNR